MAAYPSDSDLTHPFDYELVENSFVVLFWSTHVLGTTVTTLGKLGYHVVTCNAAHWAEEDQLHDDISSALHFPGYYGRNFNALDDCLWDVAQGDYGLPQAATGLVLVLTNFDRFSAEDSDTAHAFLNMFAGQARHGALIGRRMMWLVQSTDPLLELDPIGAHGVNWSRAEQRFKDRGLPGTRQPPTARSAIRTAGHVRPAPAFTSVHRGAIRPVPIATTGGIRAPLPAAEGAPGQILW